MNNPKIEFSSPTVEIVTNDDSEIVPGDLRAKAAVLATANVTDADVNDAIEKWRDNPPLPEFENILDAVEVDE